MIITYIRSSSYSTFDMCPHSYFLQYGLGIQSPPSKKTTVGSIVHKALEMIAKQKLAMQNNETTVREEETETEITTTTSIEDLVDIAYDYYSQKENHIDWEDADREQCLKWTNDALNMSDGVFNPMNCDIVAPELYFDIEFKQPWAKYKYTLPDGSTLEGQLAMKGTSDLLIRHENGTLEIIDYKTGRKWDWAKDVVKDYHKLRNDVQLHMYFMAVCHLFPDVKNVIVTILYIQDGEVVKSTKKKKGIPNRGVYSMAYERDVDLPLVEKWIKRRFEEIRGMARPKLRKTWKCKAFCHFGRNKWKDTDNTICAHMESELKLYGLNGTIERYGNISALTQYQEGGGSTKRDKDEKRTSD